MITREMLATNKDRINWFSARADAAGFGAAVLGTIAVLCLTNEDFAKYQKGDASGFDRIHALFAEVGIDQD